MPTMSGPMDPERCEDCGRPVSTPEDAKRYAGGEGEHLCWGGCEPPSPAEFRAEIERLRDQLARAIDMARKVSAALRGSTKIRKRLRGERDDAQHEALRWAARDRIGQRHPGQAVVERTAARLAAERGWDHLRFGDAGTEAAKDERPDAQAALDARAHAQLEGQYAATYGGASLSEVAALEGIEIDGGK